jgi:hypothetical protein
MVCPSVWIRRLRHYKRSLQEVWPFARIHRFKRWLKSRTRGLAICRQKSGERAREKRSVLLSRFVVFVTGSVRLSRGLSNCRPLVCPLPRRKKACPTVALSNCRLRGFPHDATAGAQTKGLVFCGGPAHKGSGHLSALDIIDAAVRSVDRGHDLRIGKTVPRAQLPMAPDPYHSAQRPHVSAGRAAADPWRLVLAAAEVDHYE